jgi:hypothetical protein
MRDTEDETWTLLESSHEGSPLLVRFRRFVRGVDCAAYPIRLNIFWQMTKPDHNGLASPTEGAALELFENRLVSAVERDRHSLLSVVLTRKGQREFVFHSPDSTEFLQRLSDMPQEVEPYPIEIHRNDDPDWEYYRSVTGTG